MSSFTLAAARAAFLHPEYGWKTTHFWGPVANFGLVGAAAFDAFAKGPDVISLKMTGTMTVYSGLFMLFAWRVQPRNYLLLSCHTMNVGAQLYQLRRGLAWRDEQLAAGKEAKENFSVPMYGAIVAAVIGLGAAAGPIHKTVSKVRVPDIMTRFINHPAGPFTIHFWAPTSKWMLSITNIMDFNRPIEKMSVSQQTALCTTGYIWSRYSMVITPKNYNLFAVNLTLAATGTYQLGRKLKYDWDKSSAAKVAAA